MRDYCIEYIEEDYVIIDFGNDLSVLYSYDKGSNYVWQCCDGKRTQLFQPIKDRRLSDGWAEEAICFSARNIKGITFLDFIIKYLEKKGYKKIRS